MGYWSTAFGVYVWLHLRQSLIQPIRVLPSDALLPSATPESYGAGALPVDGRVSESHPPGLVTTFVTEDSFIMQMIYSFILKTSQNVQSQCMTAVM